MEDMNDPDDIYSKKKPSLYLAVDNDPDYRGKPIAKEVEEKKNAKKPTSAKKKTEKKVKSQEEVDQEETGEYNFFQKLKEIPQHPYVRIIGALTLGFGVGFYLRGSTNEQLLEENRPREIITLSRDFNHDGVSDAYVELKNGHKVPLYGIRDGNGDNIKYVSAKEMKQISPMSDEYYDSIEFLLNNLPENSRW